MFKTVYLFALFKSEYPPKACLSPMSVPLRWQLPRSGLQTQATEQSGTRRSRTEEGDA